MFFKSPHNSDANTRTMLLLHTQQTSLVLSLHFQYGVNSMFNNRTLERISSNYISFVVCSCYALRKTDKHLLVFATAAPSVIQPGHCEGSRKIVFFYIKKIHLSATVYILFKGCFCLHKSCNIDTF